MWCPSCGYAIDQQRLDHCPQCGRSLTTPADQQTVASAPFADPVSPPPSGVPVSSSAQEAPPSPYTPYTPYVPYAQSGQSSVYPPAPDAYGQPYGQSAPPNYPPPDGPYQPAYPPPSGYFQAAYPPMGYAQPPYVALPPAPPAQRKSRVGLIIGIVTAVVVVLAACMCGAIFAAQSLGHSAAIRVFPTITVYTPTPAPTPTTIPVRTVIYQNTFASGADGWSTDTSTCFWKSDGYHVTDGYECYAPAGVQTDVDISVRAKQLSGDTQSPYGIVFGLDDKNNDYQFVIVGDSSWALFRCTNNGCASAVDYTDDPAILGGLRTSNRLEVLVQGTHFEFYVNGTRVGSYDDPNYTAGRVGVAAGENVECAFTDFVVSRP